MLRCVLLELCEAFIWPAISEVDNPFFLFVNLYLTRQVSYELILIYNDGLPQPNPNPDDTGPIVCRPMGLPISAGCDTA